MLESCISNVIIFANKYATLDYDTKFLFDLTTKIRERLYFEYKDFDITFDEQQITLLTIFIGLLLFNITIICLIWKNSSSSILKKFKKRVKRKEIDALKRSVDQLKLPKAHSPRSNSSKKMTDKLKSFFEKRRRDNKFKGQGHRLNETGTKDDKNKVSTNIPQQERAEPCQEAKQAGLAALARLENQNVNAKPSHKFFRKEPTFSNTSGLENSCDSVKDNSEDYHEYQEIAAVQGVYFKCPLVGPEILSKDEWKKRIESFLYEQLDTEKGFTSCIMIHTLNRNREKIEKCIDTLCAYLLNIISFPSVDKYKKIRFMNRIFQERVVNIIGAIEFLEAAGFIKTSMVLNDEQEEEVLVFTATEPNIPYLELMIDSLNSTEAVPLELCRNTQILKPSEASIMTQLPDEFYTLTAEEIKREQKKRTNDLESSMQLKTKAMREKEEQRETKKYRYTLIRIRFPDDQVLQGTFGVYERFNAVREFVQSCINDNVGQFNLANVFGTSFPETDYDKSLLDLKLVPAVIIIFIPQLQNKQPDQTYLLEELPA